MEILIRGGRILDPASGVDRQADLLLRNGVVASLGETLDADGARVVDARGCLVTPGFIDLHAHLREPGYEQKGTIATETRAALLGGFTTICAMPNTIPALDSGPVVESLLRRIAADAAVRVLPIGCVTRGREGAQLADLSELAAAGCVAFSDDGSPVADGRLMRNALLLAWTPGLPISEHSDDPQLSAGGVMNEGSVSERLGLGAASRRRSDGHSANIALCEAPAPASTSRT
jgi:dihydroorotase